MSVITVLFLTISLTGCQNNLISPIPTCHIPDELKSGSTWRDLIEKYVETRDSLILCANKVVQYNERLE